MKVQIFNKLLNQKSKKIKETETTQLRQCIVTRKRQDKTKLIRFVIDPQNQVVPDLKQKLPGRGVWVTAQQKHLKAVIEKQLFKKAFRKDVEVQEDLVNYIDNFLQKTVLQNLALANKAGHITCGFTKVFAAIEKKNIIALLHAHEAQPDGRQKLQKKWINSCSLAKTHKKEELQRRIIDTFNIEQLSTVLGRPKVMHAALEESGIALKIVENFTFLKDYYGDDTDLKILDQAPNMGLNG